MSSPDLPSGCWGKINRGQSWFPLTIDVGRALSVARLGEYERTLIFAIQERSWGSAVRSKSRDGSWPDARPFTLTMAELAEEVAPGDVLVRKLLARAYRTLIDSRMIREAAGGLVIETDVSLWVDRIPANRRRYCLAGQDSHKPAKPNGRNSKVPAENFPVPEENSEVPIGNSEVPDGNFSVPPHYRNAGVIETKKTPEDNTNSRARGGLRPDEYETPSRPANLPAALLVADELPPAPVPPAPSPRPAPTDDDRLADWCKAEVDRAYPDDEQHGEAIFRGVRQWRASGVERHVIAAFVADACGVSFRSIKTNVPRFVADRVRRFRPADGHPPVPAEWAPRVAGPELHVPDPEWLAMHRARIEAAKNGQKMRLAASTREAARRPLGPRVAWVEVAS